MRNSAKLAWDENHFSPLITHSSPSRSARVTNPVGSEPPLRLRHRVRRDHVLREQRLEVPLLQFVGAVVGEDLGVAGVRCLAAEHDRRAVRPTEDLVEQGELHLAVAGSAEVRAEVAGPQAAVAHLLLQRGDQGLAHRILHVPRVMNDLIDRLDLVADEVVDPIELGLELRIGFEVPTHDSIPSRPCRLTVRLLP